MSLTRYYSAGAASRSWKYFDYDDDAELVYQYDTRGRLISKYPIHRNDMREWVTMAVRHGTCCLYSDDMEVDIGL